MRVYFLLALCCMIGKAGTGQNYQAMHGSSYAGSLGTGNNPASIVNTPWPWDLTIFGIQAKGLTNAITIRNYSLLSPPGNAAYEFNKKDIARYGNANYNINLLNARFSINRKSAIAAGVNIRGYTRAHTSRVVLVDTARNLDSWLVLNQNNLPLSGNAYSSNWIEVFGTYSRTIFDLGSSRLNAGITVKIMRGLAGGYGQLQDGNVQLIPGTEPRFRVTGLNAFYAYSANFDRWNNNKSNTENIRNFIANAEGGFSADLGVEYLLRDGGIRSFNDGDEDYWDYDWKFGLSLLDIGYNKYRYSPNSRMLSNLKPGIEATDFDTKFGKVDGIRGFNDSLATLYNTIRVPTGIFNVINPMRAVLNADRWITQALYVNAELSLNLSPLAGKQRLYMKELNLLTVTPRWETRKFGVYLPLQYNDEKKFWVGAAIKAGPVLFGLHNLAYIFSKSSLQTGGGYLALVVKPGRKKEVMKEKNRDKRSRQYECPPL